MLKIAVAAVAGLLLAGCGTEVTEPASVSIDDTVWDGDTVTIEVDTNLPDGTVLSWLVVEGDNWDGDVNTSGFATVDGGDATGLADVSGFDDGTALVEVAFLPSYSEQPDTVADMYEPNEGATDEGTVNRR